MTKKEPFYNGLEEFSNIKVSKTRAKKSMEQIEIESREKEICLTYQFWKSTYSDVAKMSCNLVYDFVTFRYTFPFYNEQQDKLHRIHKKLKLQLLKFNMSCRKFQLNRANLDQFLLCRKQMISYDVKKIKK